MINRQITFKAALRSGFVYVDKARKFSALNIFFVSQSILHNERYYVV